MRRWPRRSIWRHSRSGAKRISRGSRRRKSLVDIICSRPASINDVRHHMTTRFWQGAAAVAVTLVLMAGQLHAAEKKIRVTGIYSDLYFNQEGGDLLGHEIFIVYTSGGYVAFVQESLGEPGMPGVVPVQVHGDTLSFNVPDPSGGND